MVRFVVLFTVLAPFLVLAFARKRPFWQFSLILVGVQILLSGLYVLTNGLTLVDFFTGNSHGTITLLFIYVSDILALFVLIGRGIWVKTRKVEPEIWDDQIVN